MEFKEKLDQKSEIDTTESLGDEGMTISMSIFDLEHPVDENGKKV